MQAIDIETVKMVVFDEADSVLGDENSDHCTMIADKLKGKDCQFIAFSATVTEPLINFFEYNFANN